MRGIHIIHLVRAAGLHASTPCKIYCEKQVAASPNQSGRKYIAMHPPGLHLCLFIAACMTHDEFRDT